MASINRLAWTLNYSSLQLSSVSVCPSPTAPNPLNILSQITSLWSLSCISNCQCFRSLPLRLPDFRVAISLIPSRFNATPRNLGFKKSLLVMCFHRQAATLRIFRSRNLCALEKGLQSLKGPFGGWGWVETTTTKKQCVITAFKWTPVLVQSTLPCICLLKAECSTRTKLLPFFPLWLLQKDIYTDSTFLFNLEKYASLSFSCRPRNYLPFIVRSASRWVVFWDTQRKQSPIHFIS